MIIIHYTTLCTFQRDGLKGESEKTKMAWTKKTQQELPKRRQEKITCEKSGVSRWANGKEN